MPGEQKVKGFVCSGAPAEIALPLPALSAPPSPAVRKGDEGGDFASRLIWVLVKRTSVPLSDYRNPLPFRGCDQTGQKAQ